MLLGLPLVLSLPTTVKTQNYVHLGFNSNSQLTNDISSDIQKLLRYFNGTVAVSECH